MGIFQNFFLGILQELFLEILLELLVRNLQDRCFFRSFILGMLLEFLEIFLVLTLRSKTKLHKGKEKKTLNRLNS